MGCGSWRGSAGGSPLPPGKEEGDYLRLLRIDPDGNPIPAWRSADPTESPADPEPPPSKPAKKGLFARMFGGSDSGEPATKSPAPPPPDDDLPDSTVVSVGADGSVYLCGNETLVRIAPDGHPIYRVELQCYVLYGRPIGLPDGTVQVLGDSGQWRRIAPDGSLAFCSPASLESGQELEAEQESDDDEE